jgi:hypothetical protein
MINGWVNNELEGMWKEEVVNFHLWQNCSISLQEQGNIVTISHKPVILRASVCSRDPSNRKREQLLGEYGTLYAQFHDICNKYHTSSVINSFLKSLIL